MIACCIFDLDGVLVDTARYHYMAWAELARSLGFDFTPSDAEDTKGVSRMDSLDIVLHSGGMENRFTQQQKEQMAAAKNARYLEFVGRMTPSEVLPGVVLLLRELRLHGVKIALGSASKNAGEILDRCALREFFDAVVDGTLVSRAKPNPEVFLLGAELAGVAPADCVVFEDAAAGIEAARRGGMRSVGVGDGRVLAGATICVSSLEIFNYERLIADFD